MRRTDSRSGPSRPSADRAAHAPVGACAVSGRRLGLRRAAWPLASLPLGAVLLCLASSPATGQMTGAVEDTIPTASAPGDTVRRIPVLILDELVVTAARRPQRLKDAVVPTTLITREAIEATGAADVASVLTSRIGLELDGGVPGSTGIRLQGLGSQRVLILLDGEPIAGRINGSFDLSRLPASIVERIEVVEGPQSVLYGSDALGGVINIITRAPAERSMVGGLDLVLGSHSRVDLAGDARGRLGNFGYTAMAGHRGVDLAPGVSHTSGTRAERWDAHATLEWRPSPEFELSAGALMIMERQRYLLGQLYNFSDNDQWVYRLGGEWRSGAHRLTPGLAFSRFNHLYRTGTRPTPIAGTGQDDRQDLLKASLVYGGPLLGGTIDAGIEHRREELRADRVASDAPVLNTTEPFVQLGWTLGGLSISPGARLTWSEQWGREVTPRVAFLYRPESLPLLAIRASAGRGFRAPDFKELYLHFVNSSAGYAVVGNPDLTPETSTNIALSTEWSGARLYSRVDLFHSEFRDFIETGEAGTPGTFTYENLSAGRISGLKAELGYDWGPARVETGYSLVRSREDQTGGPILGNPRHAWRLSLSAQPVERVRVSAATHYTGRTPTSRAADGTIHERDPFVRIDARLMAALPKSFELGLGVENLLDRDPGPNWPGFTGRRIFASLSWRPWGDQPGDR